MAVDLTQKKSPLAMLLTPSASEVVLNTFFAGLIIFLNQFNAIAGVLQLPNDFRLVSSITRGLDSILTQTFGETLTQTLVVGAFWAVVGLGVYVFLQGIARFLVELGQGMETRRYYWPKGANRYRPLWEAVQKIMFRGFALLALLYVLAVPMARLLSGPVWEGFIGSSRSLQIIVWFLALWTLMHIVVVLIRLIMLRPRIFG